MRIVVNADDYGLNERVTSAILECFSKGWITQTTLLVNKPYADEAVCRARAAHVDDKIGLHLNFTDGTPLTDPIRRFRQVCNERGEFFRNKAGMLVMRPFEDDEFREAIRIEARAQIEKYLSYKLPLMHCDGHHHVHNRPQFCHDIFPLLQEYGFKTLRNRYTIFSYLTIRGWKWIWINRKIVRMAKGCNLAMTRGFGSWEGESLDKWRRFGSVEIMVHPNYDERGRNVNVLDFKNITGPEMSLLKRQMDMCA